MNRSARIQAFLVAALALFASGRCASPPMNADAIRFTDNRQVAARERVLAAYLREAMGNATAGKRAPKQPHELVLPAELIAELAADAELAAAFRSLTPGRQRSYVIALASAKAAATRVARIAKFRSRILAGKGAQER